MAERKIKVILVGDGGVGKSTYVQRLIEGTFDKRYIATMGADVKPFVLETDKGLVQFNIWDCAGQEKFQGGGFKGYCAGADFAIVMFDVTSLISYKNCKAWIAKLPEGLPFVLVGNKVDCPGRKVKPDDITIRARYYDISAKSCYNHAKPWLHIANSL